MMDLGQRQAIREDRLPKLLVRIHGDVSGIEQPRLGQMRDRTATAVGAQDSISKTWDSGLIVTSLAFRQADRTGPCFTSRLGIVAGCVALPQSRLGIAHETVSGLR